MDKPAGQRLDSWLWASRFYKSRKLASAAIAAGHVKLNSARSKPGKMVKIGDSIALQIGTRKFHIEVTGYMRNRGNAVAASTLYHEPEWSRSEREAAQELLRRNREGIRYARGKPQKRERRAMLGMKQQTPPT